MMSLLAAIAQVVPILVFLWIALPAAATGGVVTHLPGFDGPLPFHFETGYEEIDEAKDAHIFYYFLKSERQPAEDPLVLWLTGGPGCSGFSGLVFEIGPLKFDVAGYNEGLPNLVYNPYTWTKECNIIFIDSPVGTGFSYASQSQDYENGDSRWAIDVYTFIVKWFTDHTEFLSNPLYIGGDSYAGLIVPIVTQSVANGNQAGLKVPFNLKGYFVGNPVTDRQLDSGSFVPYAHRMGLISDELYKGTRTHWERCDFDLPYTYDITSAVKFHYNLTSKGFRALVYSGDHDMYVPHVGTQAWIRSLNFSIVDDWRPWFVNEEVAGFTRIYSNNLTFATVKGGGHTAPEYKPKESQAMFLRWMSEVPL